MTTCLWTDMNIFLCWGEIGIIILKISGTTIKFQLPGQPGAWDLHIPGNMLISSVQYVIIYNINQMVLSNTWTPCIKSDTKTCLNFIVCPINPNVAAGGQSYFHFLNAHVPVPTWDCFPFCLWRVTFTKAQAPCMADNG